MRRAVSETIPFLRPALCCGQNSLHARVSHKLAHALKWATNWLKFGSEAASANEKCRSDRCALGQGFCGSPASPLFCRKPQHHRVEPGTRARFEAPRTLRTLGQHLLLYEMVVHNGGGVATKTFRFFTLYNRYACPP